MKERIGNALEQSIELLVVIIIIKLFLTLFPLLVAIGHDYNGYHNGSDRQSSNSLLCVLQLLVKLMLP